MAAFWVLFFQNKLTSSISINCLSWSGHIFDMTCPYLSNTVIKWVKLLDPISSSVCTTTLMVTPSPWIGYTLSSTHTIISRAVCLPFTLFVSSAESACSSLLSLPSSILYLKFGPPLGGSNSSKAGAFSMLYTKNMKEKGTVNIKSCVVLVPNQTLHLLSSSSCNEIVFSLY